MDRQNHRGIGALKSSGLLGRRHNRPPQGCGCECRCDFYQPDWLTRQDRTMAIAAGGINLDAGETIAFTDGCDDGDVIRLHGPGIYYAAYTFHMPTGVPLEAALCLNLDGCDLPESRVQAANTSACTQRIFAQAMFSVAQPAELRLVTQMPLQLPDDCAAPHITLAVFRIG